MQIINDVKLDFQDVLIRPKRSKTVSRSKVDLIRTYDFLNSTASWAGVPIIASNMDSTGTFAMAEVLSSELMMTCLHKHYDIKKLAGCFDSRNQMFYTMGIKDEDFAKLSDVRTVLGPHAIKYYCVDAANGYTEFFQDRAKRLRDAVGEKAVIMAGNVCTPEMVSELLISGSADIVKVGIGPGSVCTTRRVAGVGYPQLSAIIECADAAHGCGGHICADGGCREPGDIVKAFAAGADFVMLGGMFAGTAECEGEWLDENGLPTEYESQRRELVFYGMSSKEANKKYSGGLKKYRAAEGKCVTVPYKGSVREVMQEITGGLRSACAYVGTDKLKDLSKCTTFVRVNRTHNTVYG